MEIIEPLVAIAIIVGAALAISSIVPWDRED